MTVHGLHHNKLLEEFDSCILVEPGRDYVMEADTELVIKTVSLSPIYKISGKTLALYVINKKYLEILESRCTPFYTLEIAVRLTPGVNYRLYAEGPVYLCGRYRRPIISEALKCN